MTFSKSEQIGDKGEHLFSYSLPRGWKVVRRIPDYRLDYEVELFEDSVPLGLQFLAQVKTVGHVKKASRPSTTEILALSMDVADIVYYVDDRTEPIFVFLVDLKSESVYWVFIQKFVNEVLDIDIKRRNWRNQKTVTIRVPKYQRLNDDCGELKQAVVAARQYMKDLHPGTVESALANEKKKLEALDSRARVDIETSTIGGKKYHIYPKEDIDVTLNLRGPSDVMTEKYKRLIADGQPTEFEQGELDIEGSRLFKHSLKSIDGTIVMQIARHGSAESIVRILDDENNTLAWIGPIEVKTTSGKEKSTLNGQLGRSPIGIHLEIDGSTSHKASVKFDPSAWLGQKILELEYFDVVANFVEALAGGSKLEIECSVKGNHAITATSTCTSLRQDRWSLLVKILEQARFVGREFGRNPLYTRLTAKNAYDITILSDLLKHGQCIQAAPNEEYETKIDPKSFIKGLEAKGGKDPFCLAIQSEEDQYLPFFGDKVNVGKLLVQVSSVTLVNTASIRNASQRIPTRNVLARFRGTSDCMLVRRWDPSALSNKDQD